MSSTKPIINELNRSIRKLELTFGPKPPATPKKPTPEALAQALKILAELEKEFGKPYET